MGITYTVDPSTLEAVMIKVSVVPLTGGTVTLTQARSQYYLINPAGTLTTLTINMPASPLDGDRVRIGTSKTLTAVTMNGNGNTLNQGLASFVAGGFGEWIYDLSTTSWYRFG